MPFKTDPKPRYRAMAVRCVRALGPWVYGDRYLVLRVNRVGETAPRAWFDILTDGEHRVVPDTYFEPCNPDNWRHFGARQRLRFAPESLGGPAPRLRAVA